MNRYDTTLAIPGWMVDGCMDGWDGWNDEWMHGCIDGLGDGWMDGRIDRWIDRLMRRRVPERINFAIQLPMSTSVSQKADRLHRARDSLTFRIGVTLGWSGWLDPADLNYPFSWRSAPPPMFSPCPGDLPVLRTAPHSAGAFLRSSGYSLPFYQGGPPHISGVL